MKPLNKKLISLLTVLVLILSSLPFPSFAEGESTVMEFTLNKKTYTVNGTATNMDAAPVSRNERTLLPVIYVAGPLGAEINWEPSTKKVTISLNETLLELWIGKGTAKINGTDTPIDAANSKVKPITLNGRTMLPLRFVAESLGCDVNWNGATQGITVTSIPKGTSGGTFGGMTGDKFEKLGKNEFFDNKIIDRYIKDSLKTEPPKTETSKTEPSKTESSKTEPTKAKTVDTLTEADLKKQGFHSVKHLGKGYDIFGEFGSVNSTKLPILDFDKLLKNQWIQGKDLGSDIKHDTIIAESLKEYCKEMSNRTKVSGGFMGFSASAEVNFGETKQESENRYHATHMYSRTLHDFYIHPELMSVSLASFLNPDAKKAINEGSVKQLFKNYGHYVLMGLKTGGRADINVSTESKTVYGKDDFALKVRAGYNAIVGSVDAENEYRKSTAYKNFASKSRIGIRIVGNDSTVFLKDFLEGGNTLREWEKNIERHPTMIGFSSTNPDPLIPIWMFADTEKRRNEIKAEFDKIKGEIESKIPGAAVQSKNYLYGIRLGRANEGMDVAIERVTTKEDNGTAKHAFCTWNLLTTDPKELNHNSVTADLNYGATREDRDYIVLGLGWYEQRSKSVKIPGFNVTYTFTPITDICIYQGNKDTKSGTLSYNHYGSAKRERLAMDLNTNARGDYLYLMWTNDNNRPPIKELALCIQDENGGPNEKFPGWEVVRYAGSNMWANLNAGVVNENNGTYTDAPALYLVMKRERED